MTEENQLSTLLVDQSPDAIIFADKDGIIRVWSEMAAMIFGFPPSKAIGENLDIIIPESFREQHWTGYDRALAAGESKYKGQSLPTKALTAEGGTIYVELGFSIVKDAAGTVLGAMATARNITERFQRDRDTRREMRDLQAKVKELSGVGE